jgi:uroporphyrin-3 C-methyltransferase
MADSENNKSTNEAPAKAEFEPLEIEKMPAKGKKPKKASSFFTYILLLLVLASMAGVGFLWQQLQHLSADLMKESSYQLDLQAQKQSNTQVQSELETARAQLEENQKTIDVLNQDLKQLKIQIAGISGVNRVDWLVDELQHLTRLAHQRLVLSHDANGAIALLKAADQVVVEMRQSAALPVRQAVASDLLDLRLAADVDLEGAYIRLDSLSEKIEELAFQKPDYSEKSDLLISQVGGQEKTGEGEFYNPDFGNAATNVLKKIQPYFFNTFPIEEDVKPLLSSSERDYLSRNMLLAIEEAQLALLRREPESYRLSLEQSERWIKQYYDVSDPLTTSVLALIEELKSYRLNPKMPEINKTLTAVKLFSEQWQDEKVNKPKLRRSLAQ